MYRVVIVCVLSMTLTVVCQDETDDTWKKGCIDRCKKRTQPDSDHEYDVDDCEDKCYDCVWDCEYKGSCAKSCLNRCERCGQRCSQDEDPYGCNRNCRSADRECKGDNDCVDDNLQCMRKYGEENDEKCFKCTSMCKNSCPCIRNCMRCNNEKHDDLKRLVCVVCADACAGDDRCRRDCFNPGAPVHDDAPECNDVPADDSTRLVSPLYSYACAGDHICRSRCAQCVSGCETNGVCLWNCLSHIIKKDRNGDSAGDDCRGQGYFSDMAYKLFRDLLAPRRHR